MFDWLLEFLQRHEDKFLAVLLGLIGYLFGRWEKSRRPRLSKEARSLLRRIKADNKYAIKGVTIHDANRLGMNYWTHRMLGGDEAELGMFYPVDGEYAEVLLATGELLTKGYLTIERQTDGGVTVYRLAR